MAKGNVRTRTSGRKKGQRYPVNVRDIRAKHRNVPVATNQSGRYGPGVIVGLGHSDLWGIIERRPTKAEYDVLRAKQVVLYGDITTYSDYKDSWIIRIPVQEEFDREQIDVEDPATFWQPYDGQVPKGLFT